MPHWISQDTSNMTDEAYQAYSLQGVSRTFALTIPQLPDRLRVQVGNAYLLCRITDTIEDEAVLTIDQKLAFASGFVNVVKGEQSADTFATSLFEQLTDNTPEAERDLIRNTARVVRVTHSFSLPQRRAIERCVEEMATGMIRYQQQQSLDGLRDIKELSDYCYYVAGVVGILLTELFCDYSQDMAKHRDHMSELAVSFGQGLQMTNILKDIWEDQQRGACWLPRSVFASCDFAMKDLAQHRNDACYQHSLEQLIALASMHLANALEYTLLVPVKEKGIRKFCFWALGMALLTLRKINRHRDFCCGQDVKISRRQVKATVVATELVHSSDRRARWLFDRLARELPQAPENLMAIDPAPASHKVKPYLSGNHK
jgi:farnesyl-diphosphate farnesyltransferase